MSADFGPTVESATWGRLGAASGFVVCHGTYDARTGHVSSPCGHPGHEHRRVLRALHAQSPASFEWHDFGPTMADPLRSASMRETFHCVCALGCLLGGTGAEGGSFKRSPEHGAGSWLGVSRTVSALALILAVQLGRAWPDRLALPPFSSGRRSSSGSDVGVGALADCHEPSWLRSASFSRDRRIISSARLGVTKKGSLQGLRLARLLSAEFFHGHFLCRPQATLLIDPLGFVEQALHTYATPLGLAARFQIGVS